MNRLDLFTAAELAGIAERRLEAIERGRAGATFLEVVALARAYGISIDEFQRSLERPPGVQRPRSRST